ncbi:MAG: Cu(I)-responsive transcriptional regulator [Alphaproteobacteria bacterium]|nr:Cu(I)-responsive transcriptional regulator [Alphaproteobacteria bacterium]
MNIGEAAKLSGVPAKTIRYYDEIDLIKPSGRTAGGYRDYDERAVESLRFVRHARGLGFSVEDCRALLSLYRDRNRASADVKSLTAKHLARIESKIAELESMKRTLQDLTARCQGDDRPDCPILDNLAGPERSRAEARG